MRVDVAHTLPRFIELLQRAPGVIMHQVDLAVMRASIEGARQMKGDAPKNTSELVNSIRNVQLGLAFHAVVATAPHAKAVHDGSRPGGAPPLDILRAWIRTAQIRPRTDTDARGLAFLIQRKIRRDGIKARPFSERTRQTSQQRLAQLIPLAVEHANREVFG